MTLKEAIYYTMKKHPDPKEGYNCSSILNTYFNIRDGKRIRDEIKLTAFSSKVDGKEPRKEMEKLKEEGIIKELEIVTGLKIESAGLSRLIRDYSLKYDSSFKNNINNINQNNNYINANLSTLDSAKNLLNYLYEMENIDVRKALIYSYDKNVSLKNIIELANEKLVYSGTPLLSNTIEAKVDNFLTYMNSYFELDRDKLYNDYADQATVKIDSIFPDGMNYNSKQKTLVDIFLGNDNKYLPYLRNDLTKKEVVIALLKNAVQASIVSTNVKDRSNDEYILYKDIDGSIINEYIVRTREIINKVLGYDSRNLTMEVSVQDIIANIKNLREVDVSFLSGLYLMLRDNEEARRVLDKCQNKRYDLVDSNSTQYKNDSFLLKMFNTEDFNRALDDNYHV